MQGMGFFKTAGYTVLVLLTSWLGLNLAKYSYYQSVWVPSKFKDVSYLCWLIHPNNDDKKAVQMWEEFLSDVRGQNTFVFLDGAPPDQLEDESKLLKGQLYYGGHEGDNLSWRVERALPQYEHLVLGRRIGECMKDQVEYLLKQRVPAKNIHVLSRYSFCCNDPRDIQKAVDCYKGEGIDVFEGRVKDLLIKE